jgi:hypothetical protein
MKRWSADHLRLAGAAVDVRAELRRLAAEAGGELGARLAAMAGRLTAALKARGCSRQPAAAGSGGCASLTRQAFPPMAQLIPPCRPGRT